jgi:hypothetical protein
MDSRGMLNTIVQSATVELFAACGVAAAPLPQAALGSNELEMPEISASISFSGSGFSGTLTLAMAEPVFVLMKQDPTRPFKTRDWIRELTNQLMGRLKKRLLQFQVTLTTGLPSASNSSVTQRQGERSGSTRIFLFRTLRGQILVSLQGALNEAALKYEGQLNLAGEGDIIIF